jgi:hypothetical protein
MKGVGVLLFHCIDDWTSVVLVYKVQPGYIIFICVLMFTILQVEYDSRQYQPCTNMSLLGSLCSVRPEVISGLYLQYMRQKSAFNRVPNWYERFFFFNTQYQYFWVWGEKKPYTSITLESKLGYVQKLIPVLHCIELSNLQTLTLMK